MTLPYESQRPIASDNVLAVAVYLLYFLGYFTAISALRHQHFRFGPKAITSACSKGQGLQSCSACG
jgi:hypothetical protein